MRTLNSPPDNTVQAEMTYYETRPKARVFSAGVIAFGGSPRRWNVAEMLENLWARMAPGTPEASQGGAELRASPD